MIKNLTKIASDIQNIIRDSKATFFVKDKKVKISKKDALYELRETISDNVGMYFYRLKK